MKPKPIKGWAIFLKATGEILLEAGVSEDKEMIQPNPIYKKHYSLVKVLITPITK